LQHPVEIEPCLRQAPGGTDAWITAADIYEPYLDFCRRVSIYDELLAGDVTRLDLEPLDVVVATEVLEHSRSRLSPLVLLGPPAAGSCDKFQAATPRRAFVT
jgi:hypothetical protein